MSDTPLGERIKAWRTGAQLTQAQAARRAGVGQATWSDVERGDSTPHLAFAVALEALTKGAVHIEEFGFDAELVAHMRAAMRRRARIDRAA